MENKALQAISYLQTRYNIMNIIKELFTLIISLLFLIVVVTGLIILFVK